MLMKKRLLVKTGLVSIIMLFLSCSQADVGGAASQYCPSAVHSTHGSVPFGARACSPDGTRYAREVDPANQGQIGVFDAGTGELLLQISVGETNNDLKGLAWSPDSRWLAVMYHHGSGGYIAILDASTGARFTTLPIDGWAHYMRFADDGIHIIAGYETLPIPGMLPETPPAEGSRVNLGAKGEWYLLGVNYPWQYYGHDFGVAGTWEHDGASSAQSWEQIDADFAYLQEQGVHVVRWFLFGDGRASPEFSEEGQVIGYDEYFYPDVDAALAIAEKHDLYLIFVLFDFLICDEAQIGNGAQLFGRCELITDPVVRQSFLDNALKPLLERYGQHPNIIAWEVINEPEGAMDIAQGAWVGMPISATVMQDFVNDVVGYIHTYSSQAATLGSASRGSLVTYWRDCPLDFYQFHHYDHLEAQYPLDYAAADLELDKPVIVGEFPTANTRLTLAQYLDVIWQNGYAGALAWSYRADDDASDFVSGAADFKVWSEAHDAEVNITPLTD
jgi:hypothetical protein